MIGHHSNSGNVIYSKNKPIATEICF